MVTWDDLVSQSSPVSFDVELTRDGFMRRHQNPRHKCFVRELEVAQHSSPLVDGTPLSLPSPQVELPLVSIVEPMIEMTPNPACLSPAWQGVWSIGWRSGQSGQAAGFTLC